MHPFNTVTKSKRWPLSGIPWHQLTTKSWTVSRRRYIENHLRRRGRRRGRKWFSTLWYINQHRWVYGIFYKYNKEKQILLYSKNIHAFYLLFHLLQLRVIHGNLGISTFYTLGIFRSYRAKHWQTLFQKRRAVLTERELHLTQGTAPSVLGQT